MSGGGAAEVVRALEDEGIPFTFGIPGTHNIELYDALSRSDSVRPILVTDEQSASFMADGMWRACGRLGCVNVVPGAGLTHALSGIAEAYMDNVAMLVLGCGVRRGGMSFQLHDVDQLAIVRPVVKGAVRPDRIEQIYPTIRRACALARSGAPGPVMVEIPVDLYLERGRGFPVPAASGSSERSDEGPDTLSAPGVATDPPAAEIERAARILRAARRPLLYVGLGAAGASERLVRLAEALEAPVATTLQGKGVFPESHPLLLWPGLGRMAPPFVAELTRECDASLAIGCRFSEVGTGSYGFTPPGPLIHVDIDPAVLGRNYPAQIAIESDADRFVTALLERLGDPDRDPDEALRRGIAAGRAQARAEMEGSPRGDGVTPARLFRQIQTTFGPDTVFTTDSGNGTFLAAECLLLERPGHLLGPIDYSCMGYAVPAALGARLGCSEAPVIGLAGDGAFLMTGLEMLTASHEGLAIAVFVLRDRELAQIAQFQGVALNRKTCSRLPDYDLAAICGGVGVECLTLSSDEDAERVVARSAAVVAAGDPVVIDVNIDYSGKTYFTRGVVRTNLARLPWVDRLRLLGRALGRRLTG